MLKLYIFLVFCQVFLAPGYNGKSILMMKLKENQPNDGNNETGELTNQVGTKQEKLSAENNLAPPKHLDAVKIGRDGSLNSNFHKEVFLGEDLENFENGKYALKEQKNKLETIFKLIDTNSDQHLDVQELSMWVLTKTREHFEEAKHENQEKFEKIDTDRDGKISWNEYLVEFLAQRNFDRKTVEEKLASKEKIEISQDFQDDVDDARNKWMQVSTDDSYSTLTMEQFLDFQHPEASKGMLAYLVDDFLHDMDLDANGILTIQEYIAVASDVDVDTQKDDWAVERREEFRKVIDADHDGQVTKQELERYLDPLSETMSEQEARQLIAFGDEDSDDKLSLSELLENSEFYTGSKLYNYALSVHDDL